LSATLKIPGGITLAGEGIKTKLFLDPAAGLRDAVVNATDDLQNVTIRDLVIEGSVRSEPPSDPNSVRSLRNPGNRGGIMFLAQRQGQMKNISLVNMTVQNCTFNGVFLSGVDGLRVSGCDFTENGSSVVPGPKLQHNLLVTHCTDVSVEGCRLDTSPYGSGIALAASTDAKITGCEIARNAYYGMLITESRDVTASDNFIEGNDRSGIMIEFLNRGSENINVKNNVIQFNDGFGVEAYASRKTNVSNNSYTQNSQAGEKISQEKFIIMR
jgi:nitrous oxidase accessory protein NosD